MKRKIIVAVLAAAILAPSASKACTNILVSRGASKDGSTMVTYTADSHTLYGCLYHWASATHPAGAMRDVHEWETSRLIGRIPQPNYTYSVIGNMNEHQLCIAETTLGGRSELVNPDGMMDYGALIYITLQRAKTAREAIKVMDELVQTYGYCSSGEAFSIADPNEVWHMEMFGKGKGTKGAVWVAMRVPEGYIGAHANHARITQIKFNDPENCLYTPDVITFAREKGLFNGKDVDFSHSDTYAPLDFSAMRACEARVWAVFNSVTKGGMPEFLDYAMGHDATKRMPLFIKPSEKLSVKDVMWLMRDHYDGTPMDMHTDMGAGGHNVPYRWRPMNFEVDGVTYVNERAIATQQTGFWFVSQSRNWLPNEIGGILWFGVDDSGLSCLTPIYSSSTRVPECLREGNGHMTEYSPTAAFWIFNRVTNFAYTRYDMISEDINKVINEVEDTNFATIPAIDAGALALLKESPAAAREFLTTYSVNTAQSMFDRWNDLDKYLLVKYMDGNVKKEKDGKFLQNGHVDNIPAMPDFPGYNEKWKKAVAADNGEILKVVTPKQ